MKKQGSQSSDTGFLGGSKNEFFKKSGINDKLLFRKGYEIVYALSHSKKMTIATIETMIHIFLVRQPSLI